MAKEKYILEHEPMLADYNMLKKKKPRQGNKQKIKSSPASPRTNEGTVDEARFRQ